MTGFSLGDALGSGFGLIFRRPLAVLAWAAAYFVLGVLPLLIILAIAAPDLMAAARMLSPHVGPPAHLRDLLPTMMLPKLMALRPIGFLATLAGRAVLMSAVLRAVLEPQESRFAYLRLGRQELWIALLNLAFVIFMVVLGFVVLLPFVAVAGAAYYALHGSPAGATVAALIMAACAIAYVGLMIWVALRLSLAGPMTFAAREFRLFESWTLTRGHVGELFALALLLLAVVIAAGTVINGVLWLVMFGLSGGALMHPQEVAAFFAQPTQAWMQALAPWAVLAIAIGCVLAAAFAAILLAPWAVAWRQLSATETPSADGKAPV